MRAILAAGLGAALAGCGAPSSAPAVAETAGQGFPRAGAYDVVVERHDGLERSDDRIEVATRSEFEKLVAKEDGANCRDRQVEIGGGSFRVRMVCDAPDGDIHNIGLERFGTYTETSIDMTEETTLWGGEPIRELVTSRLRGG